MRVADLERLYDYCHWANARLFLAMTQLTPEQFTRTVAGSYGSIRNTLVHTLSAQWGWLSRCGGRERGPKLDPADYASMENLVSTWKKVDGYVLEFLSTLKNEDLNRVVEYSFDPPEKRSATVGELMHHAAIHGVHHRGQVALLLRMLDITPGDFDILFYYEARGGIPAA